MSRIPQLLKEQNAEIFAGWRAAQRPEYRQAAQELLDGLKEASQSGNLTDFRSPEWKPVLGNLAELSRSGAVRGATPSETATFVLSLKEPLFALLRQQTAQNAVELAEETWAANLMIDKLGLYTFDVYVKSREEVIRRQRQDLTELSTPVVDLWEGVLVLPLIGTLDSERTQTVMENLLQKILDTRSEIAIIDITGVPTVDTLVAQHLLKTIAAARLMGADCIISGIRPQIAQTIVHLGVELGGVVTKATLADAISVALRRNGLGIRKIGE